MKLTSISKPQMESFVVQPEKHTVGSTGTAAGGDADTAKALLVKGKSPPLVPLRPRAMVESIIGTDDRTRVTNTKGAPWRMICALRMLSPDDGMAIGTGWLVGPRTIITAGHCVFSDHFFGGWAKEVEVIPGKNGADEPFGSVKSSTLRSVDRWVKEELPDFDVGCIQLDTRLGDQTGWFGVASLSREQLQDMLINVTGYPGDRGDGDELYHHTNRIREVTPRRLFYDVDTYGGQSGAPAYIYQTPTAPPLVVGIHAYGTSALTRYNSAPRIIPEVVDQIQAWIDEVK